MSKPKPPKKTVHLDFTLEQYELLQKRAETCGLNVTAYVRQQAVEGKAKGFDMAPMIDHTIALSEILKSVREVTDKPHAERWRYQSDIERIEHLMQEVLDTEKSLHDKLTRRVKRQERK